MFSDNGGNFVKANKELKDLVNQLETTANKGVQWSLILQQHHILVEFIK